MRQPESDTPEPFKQRLEMAAKGLLTAMMEMDVSKMRPSLEAVVNRPGNRGDSLL